MKRSTGNEEEKAESEEDCQQQKYKVQHLIQTPMEKCEQRLTEEITTQEKDRQQKALGIY